MHRTRTTWTGGALVLLVITALAGLGWPAVAGTAPLLFMDEKTLLVQAGATNAMGLLPNLVRIPDTTTTVGSITFSAPAGSDLHIGVLGNQNIRNEDTRAEDLATGSHPCQVCSKRHSMPLQSMGALSLVLTPPGVFALPFTTIDVPGAVHTGAQDISATGQIVGTYTDTNGMRHGFLLDQGTFTTIEMPGATHTTAHGINAASQVVGRYADTSGRWHGFLLDQNTFTTIDVRDGALTTAIRINAAGQIVGAYIDASGAFHGFLLDGDTFTSIDVPGAINTLVQGINTTGQIVGVYTDTSGTQHGFLSTLGD